LHHIEHRRRAVKQEKPGRRQNQRGKAGALGGLGPKPTRQPARQRHGNDAKNRGDGARGQFADAGHQPHKVDHPEQQRRLVAVKRAVQMRHGL